MLFYALDIETTSLNENTCDIVGIGIHSEKGSAYIEQPTKQDAICLFSKLNVYKIIGHNLVFDLTCIYNKWGIDLTNNVYADTQLLAHTIGNDYELSLDALSKKYLGKEKSLEKLKNSVIENGGKWLVDCKEYYKADPKILKSYCINDCKLTWELYHILDKKLDIKRRDLFFQEVMPLYTKCTIPMKFRGVCVNVNYYKKLQKELVTNINRLEIEVYDEIYPLIYKDIQHILTKDIKCKDENLKLLLGYKKWLDKSPEEPFIFNVGSSKQLQHLLYEKLGERITKRTQKKAPSTDKKLLEELSDKYPFIKKYLELKKEQKMLNTYITRILDNHIDNRIYPYFNQSGTSSGRYASDMQQLPREDKRIKKGIVSPIGYTLVSADFSALEPRCFAEVSGCVDLIDVYKKGEDLYSRLAIDVFGLQDVSALEKDENYLGKINSEYRQKMKVVALAVVYGAGAGRLSGILKCSKEEAQKIIDSYLDAYPELKLYMRSQEEILLTTNTIESSYGRIIHIPEVAKLRTSTKDEDYWQLRKYLNLAKNHPIQSLAAHITNGSMILLADAIRQHNLDAHIILQIHDQIVCECKKEQAKELVKIMKECMEHNDITKEMEVPMLANPVICKNLSEDK
jgi:DNA polymerase I-like protein with 3'-5' exonuclease and polymerase domains